MFVQFFLSQASGTKHLSNSNIISSSPDKEKLVLFHPHGFGKYHSPNLSVSAALSWRCIPASNLCFVSSPSISYPHPFYHPSLLSHWFLLLITLWSLPLSLEYLIFQQIFSCFPSSCLSYCSASLLHFIFCVNFSVSELIEMGSEKYALAFSALPYVPSILISVKMESSNTISFLLCVDTVPSTV